MYITHLNSTKEVDIAIKVSKQVVSYNQSQEIPMHSLYWVLLYSSNTCSHMHVQIKHSS